MRERTFIHRGSFYTERTLPADVRERLTARGFLSGSQPDAPVEEAAPVPASPPETNAEDTLPEPPNPDEQMNYQPAERIDDAAMAEALEDLQRVNGIGEEIARSLVTQMNIRSVADLAGANRDALLNIPSVGAKNVDGIIEHAESLASDAPDEESSMRVEPVRDEAADITERASVLVERLKLPKQLAHTLAANDFDVERLQEADERELLEVKGVGAGGVRRIQQALDLFASQSV